jgi:23S rRNA pseudouridine2605 synthase
MAEERLQKFLAAAGIASRRKAEALIVSGRVKVNERVVTELGTKIDPARDLVLVDGALVSTPEQKSYYLLYKPAGCITTASDPEGRPTALEYLRGVPARLFAVGRLDYDAEGAILFTDDGELANRLAHPRYGHRRVYLVKVKGDPPAEALERMKSGVRLEDGPAQALEVAVHEHADKNVWIRVVVGEGRFHLVKRLCESVGLLVQRLFRPEFAGVTVDGLRPGAYRPLEPAEIEGMRRLVGLSSGEPAPAIGPRHLPMAARRHGHGPPAPPPLPGKKRDARPERESRSGGPSREAQPEWPRSPGRTGQDRERERGESDGGESGERRPSGGRERAGSGERRAFSGRRERAEPGEGRSSGGRGRAESGGRRPFGGGERAGSGERRSSGGGERAESGGRRPFGGGRERAEPGERRSSGGGERAESGGRRPFSGRRERAEPGEGRSSGGRGRAESGGRRPFGGGERAGSGERKSSGGGERAASGGRRPFGGSERGKPGDRRGPDGREPADAGERGPPAGRHGPGRADARPVRPGGRAGPPRGGGVRGRGRGPR